MKKIGTKNITKQIICIIIALMLCNFIVPNYSYAVSTEGGGSFVDDFAQFFCFIPDVVIDFLQDMFVSTDNIYVSDLNEYIIKYSPGVIFSGEIPAFDINFIKPGPSKIEEEVIVLAKEFNYEELVNKALPLILVELGYVSTETNPETDSSIDEIINYLKNVEQNEITHWTIDGVEYELLVYFNWKFGFDFYLKSESNEWEDERTFFITENYNGKELERIKAIDRFEKQLRNYFGEEIKDVEGINHSQELKNLLLSKKDYFEDMIDEVQKDPQACGVGGIFTTEVNYKNIQNKDVAITIEMSIYVDLPFAIYLNHNKLTGKEYKSTASILQNTIATWYKAFRRVALVGLLSVLVYVGIKILLSSTSAKDKAKYKNMLKDWFVALCLLFVLHYVMSVTLTVVDKVNEVFKASTIGQNGEDVLMSTLRNDILNSDNWSVALANVVIYNVLAVYTIIFTIQYIKRFLHLAFLTAIAPLITLTYPLDKIKDGKAQAFGIWIRDYIFYTLLQVVHLLLYYIFLSSSMDLANKGNWLYAIVAIGFLTKAEKIMKKMFGFEKKSSVGALAAGATGALVSNLMNKITNKSSKEKKGEDKDNTNSNSSNNVRTATNNVLNSLSEIELGGVSGAGQASNNNSSEINQNIERIMGNNSTQNAQIKPANTTSKKRKIWGGVTAVGKKYGGKIITGSVRGVARGFVGGTGAMIGFAAGVAQGDMEKAIGGLTAGAVAGYHLAGNVENRVKSFGNGIKNTVEDVQDTYNRGAYGEEYASNIRFDREFRNSSDYSKLKQDNSNFSDEKVQQMLDAGITDVKRMDKILKNNKKDSKKYSMKNALRYSELARICPDNILYDNVKFIKFCQDRHINLSEEELEEFRKCIIDFK